MDKKQTALSILIVLSLLLLGFLYVRSTQTESLIQKQFETVRQNLVATTADSQRASAGERASGLFPPCPTQAQYDSLLEKDTRAMTASNLREAVSLHAACGNHFVHTKKFSLMRLEDTLLQAQNLALLSHGKNKKTIDALLTLWKDIVDLERKKTELFARQVNLQGSYFETELQQKDGSIAANERERIFGELNSEANKSIQDMNSLIAQSATAQSAEQALWDTLSQKQK